MANTAIIPSKSERQAARSEARQQQVKKRTINIIRHGNNGSTGQLIEEQVSIEDLTLEELQNLVKRRNNKIKFVALITKQTIAKTTISCIRTCDESSKILDQVSQEIDNEKEE